MIILIRQLLNDKFHGLSIRIASLLLGFYIATILSTIPAQTGDWSIISASIIITFNEILSKFLYSDYNKSTFILNLLNSIKIGIIYGLFVDAFKLGS
uniref:Uncharacterized protein ycf20 n=1 Tax=Antithamnionella ternifolia TaxID=207919 RepID=A0A4D6WJU9_9FLOR|nr:hypothetical protein [Antithamnionella ternifolia]